MFPVPYEQDTSQYSRGKWQVDESLALVVPENRFYFFFMFHMDTLDGKPSCLSVLVAIATTRHKQT